MKFCINRNVGNKRSTAVSDVRGQGALVGWALMLILSFAAIALSPWLPPWVFMWLLAVAQLLGCKVIAWAWRTRGLAHETWREKFLWLAGWPGLDADAFLDRGLPLSSPRGEWVAAVAKATLGAFLVWVVARQFPSPFVATWVGMVGLILLLHFGLIHLQALQARSEGRPVRPIMDRPLLAVTLAEFWGRRWNRAFSDFAGRAIFDPLRSTLGTAGATALVFLFSGLVHELVLSVPARGGWGGPTGYFVFQGLALLVQRRVGWLRRGPLARLFTWAVVLLPVPFLFHEAVVLRVLHPFLQFLKAL